jgi:hypothetical protein
MRRGLLRSPCTDTGRGGESCRVLQGFDQGRVSQGFDKVIVLQGFDQKRCRVLARSFDRVFCRAWHHCSAFIYPSGIALAYGTLIALGGAATEHFLPCFVTFWFGVVCDVLLAGQRVIYTTPLKALSNQKLFELRRRFGDWRVGLQTGDGTLNAGGCQNPKISKS